MKVCTHCKIEKEDSCFRFEKKWNRLRSWCRQCDKEEGEKRRRFKGIMPQKRRPPDLIPDTKVCTRCNVEKPKEDFRIRVERRHGNFRYLNNTCKKCDTDISKKNYRIWRQTPEGRERNRKWAKATYSRRRDKALAKMKEKRATPEYKEHRKKYIEKNKEKIFQQETVCKRRYHEKHRDSLTDEYIARGLIGQTDKDFINNYPELIQAKRLQILLLRKIKNND